MLASILIWKKANQPSDSFKSAGAKKISESSLPRHVLCVPVPLLMTPY
jgi:hypothetical protein